MPPSLPYKGLSGHPIPQEYGRVAPYYRLGAAVCLPVAALSMALASSELSASRAWVASVRAAFAQWGAAFAFGSGMWLMRYGSRMFRVCEKHANWLGKEAFSMLQAANFPEFFALNTAACLLALGGRLGDLREGASGVEVAGVDVALASAAAALALALVNLLVLGPMSMPLMLELYRRQHAAIAAPSSPSGGGPCEFLLGQEEKVAKQAKARFGIVHGISMLLHLAAMAFVAAYLAAVAIGAQRD